MLRSNRNLAFVVAARFISRLGGTAVWFIGTMGVAAYVFDASPKQLAIMSLVNGLFAIVGSFAAGVLIDRFGPRKVMIWAEIGSIPPVLWMMVAPSLPLFVVGSAIFSLFGIPTWTAGASFAPYITEGRDELERANAYIEGGSSVGFVLGPTVGALVETWFGITSVFWVMAVAAVIAAVAAWFTRIDESPREHVSGNAWREFADGVRLVYTTRSLRYFILLGTAVWFGFGAFQALESLFYRDVVGVGVEWLGYMNTVFGLGLVFGAALLPRLPSKVVSATGVAALSILSGLGSILYVGSSELVWIAPGAFAWGLFIGATEPLLRTLVHLDSPHEYVGRVVGTLQWHRTAGELLPLAFVPMLAVTLGIQQTLIAGGVLVALAALGSMRTARSIDRHRALATVIEAVPESA
ncbi:MAG: MFS transporter [Coriobacteriia bacterium]|nr:MFS transporter [Coriobacteriia bacterium]MBN2848542.1 MFS transporter [Coriobacteriia bacterium]